VADALAQAEAEAVLALGVGKPDLVLSAPASSLSVTGLDTLDNAYIFAISAVLSQAADLRSPEEPEPALQDLLNSLADDLADDGQIDAKLRDELRAAEAAVPVDQVTQDLTKFLKSQGLSAALPNLHRVIDQDHDGLANIDDNCALIANPDQADGDDDGIGDACDTCLEGGEDSDADGYPDVCDNCPDVHNPEPPQEEPPQFSPSSDIDGDGLGNACDSCPNSPKTGAIAGENCCDPRDSDASSCVRDWQGSTIFYTCSPGANAARFECRFASRCSAEYRESCIGCGSKVCMPGGALIPNPNCTPGSSCDCSEYSCVSKWCTVGDDAPCEDGNTCIPWYHEGEAPAGLEDLGVCALAESGPCKGSVGRECAA